MLLHAANLEVLKDMRYTMTQADTSSKGGTWLHDMSRWLSCCAAARTGGMPEKELPSRSSTRSVLR